MFEKEIAAFKEEAAVTTSSLKLALLERALWEKVKDRVTGYKNTPRDGWWRDQFSTHQKTLMGYRSQILTRCGTESDVWAKLDANELTLYAAMRQAVSMGRVVRPSQGVGKQQEKLADDQRSLWATVRAAVSDAVTPLLVSFDAVQRIKLRQEFEMEVETLLKRFHNRVYSAARSPRSEMRRQHLLNACRVLNVRPPALGKPIDSRTRRVAQRHYRDLVRNYHPDLRGGDESLRPQLDAVIEAWDVFEMFANNEMEVRNAQV